MKRSLPMMHRLALLSVFAHGSPALPEGFRTLVVSPERFVEPGMTVHARVSFTNLGGAPARGVRVHFSSPPSLTYVRDSASLDESSVPAGAAAELANDGIDIGEVAPGAVRRISIAYIVDSIVEDGTPIELQAALASQDIPVTGSNIVRLTVRSRPELASASELAITAVDTAVPDGEVLITAMVRNRGQSSASDVVVMLPTPPDTSFVGQSAQVDGRPFAMAAAREPFPAVVSAGRCRAPCTQRERDRFIPR